MHKTALLAAVLMGLRPAHAAEPVEFAAKPDHIQITIGGKPFAAYVLKDAAILRPFFAHVHAPNGVQVTRKHPPVEGTDATDHATMHPGIWLAFGDLSGGDFWRNKGAVRHAQLIDKPAGGSGSGSFAVRNRYEAAGKSIGDEDCKIVIQVRPAGYLLRVDSRFASPDGLVFGDQEEMGLGVRVATPMTVKNGGQILNSDGLKNEKQTWGKQADWCAYTGAVDGKRVGVLLMPHPQNFRRSWFHVRDYGLLVANPFGQRAFTRGEASRVTVGKGDNLRLRFGVLVFDGQIDLSAAYADYLKAADDR
jgi:hypothetical protein